MRIVFVHAVREWGGAERYTADVVGGLAARGHRVTAVVAPGSRLSESLAGSAANVVEVGLGLTVGWHAAIGPLNHILNYADLYANPLRRSLASVLDGLLADGIDVLHAQQVKEKLWVGRYGKSRGIPVAWTVHAPLEDWMKRSAPGQAHRESGGSLDALIAVNRAALDDYRRFGIRPPVSDVVYNGFDLDAYSDGDRAGTRGKLGLDADEVAVLMLARPYAGKGVRVVFDALAMGLSEDPLTFARTRFFIAGASNHLDEFRAEARERGIERAVTFLGHRDDVADLLAASDIVALPSFNEGLPYAISEGMAAAKPVVATRVGGIPEMVDDGVSGTLVEPGDAAGLMRALSELSRAPELRTSMGLAGRRLAEAKFRRETMLEGTESVLERLLAEKR